VIATFYDINMNEIDTRDLVVTNLEIPSIPFSNQWSNIEGVAPVLIGADIQQRPINATIELIAQDYLDYNLLRDYLYGLFGMNKPFYVVDKRQRGKRYKVVLESGFSPVRHNAINGTVVIPFMTVSPYAESIGTTQDIQLNGITTDSELWGYGMGLLAEDDSLVYTHNVTGGQQFAVYNAGNVPIHPFQQELNIKIHNVVGSTSYLELRNDTIGNTFRVNEGVSSTIMLDGPNITSNGLQFLRKTNKQFIQLAPGWNYFTLTGATSATVEYDFRFYYE
jgi:hypothetical protein